MKNKKIFVISCCLALLCCAFATLTIQTSAANTLPMPASIEKVRLLVLPANETAAGVTITVAELNRLMPEQAQAGFMAKMAQQGWGDSTKVKFVVAKYRNNGVWQDVPTTWDSQRILMATGSFCLCCDRACLTGEETRSRVANDRGKCDCI